MKFATQNDIVAAGFQGFVPTKDLQTHDQRRMIPDTSGVYMILRLSKIEPVFKLSGTCHNRTMREPPYAVEVLTEEWKRVRESVVVYIGKAGGASSGTHLRKRISQYMRLSSSHQGGRAIWQFADCDELLVCWKTILDGDPRVVESQLLQEFQAIYGTHPLANWSA